MNIICIDFETFYGDNYSLSKLTTEEYVRGDEFEVIGLAVRVNDGPTDWLSGPLPDLKDYLLENYDWENSAVLAHNMMFDGFILSHHFGIHPKVLLDTLCMARALHGVEVGGSLAKLAERYNLGVKGTEIVNAKNKHLKDFSDAELSAYGDYCINDVELTYKLFSILSKKFPQSELHVIDLTLRMFTDPILELDETVLKKHLEGLVTYKEALLESIGANRKDLMSNPKFAAMLENLGVVPPMKTSPRTGKETYAFAKTDEGFKALLDHDNVQVRTLAEVRMGVKSTLEDTRTTRFISIAKRGNLPVPVKYYAAHTGRWGGCLVADTKVEVYDKDLGLTTKNIVDVLADDLVWDGVEFVQHEGVVFSGYSEVIEWDGVTGTPDHKVFTEGGEVSLSEAMQRGLPIKTPSRPSKNAVDTAKQHTSNYKNKDTVQV